MNNLLIEIKNEYTIRLVNILTPLIYEGFKTIYIYVLKGLTEKGNDDHILKLFQEFLRTIPEWDNKQKNAEAEIIKNHTKSKDWLLDLIKATLKANASIYNLSSTNKNYLNFYKNIIFEDFIHNIYINCAAEFWYNPHLLYHKYTDAELTKK